MKTQEFNSHTKYRILQHGLKGKNISETCKLFGISRTSFYNWREDYEKYGMAGLEKRKRRKPRMPNKVSKTIENEILDYVSRYPKDGPRRIYYELKAEGFNVGETGIYNVLKRNNLTRSNKRIEYAKRGKKNYGKGDRKNQDLLSDIDFDTSYPGYTVIQRIDYIGSFDKIGRIYQYCFYDSHSAWGEVKLYNRKQDIDIWAYFELKLVYLLEVFNLDIENIITERTREFLPYFLKGDKYDDIIQGYNINHIFLPPKESSLFNGIIDFNKYLFKEFYNKLGHRNLDSFIKVENALSNFIREYNFTNVIAKGPSKGKTPAEAVLERAVENGTDLDTLPLWLLALINSPRGGGKGAR